MFDVTAELLVKGFFNIPKQNNIYMQLICFAVVSEEF